MSKTREGNLRFIQEIISRPHLAQILRECAIEIPDKELDMYRTHYQHYLEDRRSVKDFEADARDKAEKQGWRQGWVAKKENLWQLRNRALAHFSGSLLISALNLLSSYKNVHELHPVILANLLVSIMHISYFIYKNEQAYIAYIYSEHKTINGNPTHRTALEHKLALKVPEAKLLSTITTQLKNSGFQEKKLPLYAIHVMDKIAKQELQKRAQSARERDRLIYNEEKEEATISYEDEIHAQIALAREDAAERHRKN